MSTERVALLVYVSLDPMPGAFHTKESARNVVHGVLDERLGHYNPNVEILISQADLPPAINDAITAADFLTKYNVEGTTQA